MPVNAAALDHLLDLGEPVLTVVLQAPDASEDSDERRRVRAKDVRTQVDASGLPDAIVDRVVDALSRGAASGWQPGGWIAVVADPTDVRIVPLVHARDESVTVGALPRFVPFVRDEFEHRRHLVVICDRIGASIARVTRGEVRSVRHVEGEEHHVQKVQSGGFSQSRMQRHSEHTWDQNAREIVEALAAEAEATSAELIVVTGDERAVELVREHLPERWQDALSVDDVQPSDPADEDQFFERAAGLVRDQAATEMVELLERFAEARGRDQAADGTDAVLDALRRGAVELLLVAEDVDDPVHFAVDDPRQVAADTGTLEEMGFSDVRSGRLTDVAVRAALAGDGDVVVCPEHGPNSPEGPVGATLRF